VLHENGFYSNGDNVGYFEEGIRPDKSSELGRYTMFGNEYDDDIMKQAENNLRESGKWLSRKAKKNGYRVSTHNCQDFGDALRNEYYRLGGPIYNDPDVLYFAIPDMGTMLHQMFQ
jgi:hypothetical protein